MTVVDLYTIQIIRDDDLSVYAATYVDLRRLMEETEENLTDLLPNGHKARIRRWDHPEPDEGASDE